MRDNETPVVGEVFVAILLDIQRDLGKPVQTMRISR